MSAEFVHDAADKFEVAAGLGGWRCEFPGAPGGRLSLARRACSLPAVAGSEVGRRRGGTSAAAGSTLWCASLPLPLTLSSSSALALPLGCTSAFAPAGALSLRLASALPLARTLALALSMTFAPALPLA